MSKNVKIHKAPVTQGEFLNNLDELELRLNLLDSNISHLIYDKLPAILTPEDIEEVPLFTTDGKENSPITMRIKKFIKTVDLLSKQVQRITERLEI